jgi:hypothetical protein
MCRDGSMGKKKNQHFSTNGDVNLWEKINLNPYLIPYRTVSLNES